MDTNYDAIERQFAPFVLDRRPVAVAYLPAPPAGVPKFEGTVPSGCSFWSLAGRGQSFYTVPSDHFNCPIGSFTHAIDLPPERASELEQTLSLMTGLGYVRMDEVPTIPRLAKPPAFIYYAPLADTAVEPDVVIVAGRPGGVMRIQEAAGRARAGASLPLLGRPTCMALPSAMAHGAVTSSGCIGNRVYTDLSDDQLYVMIPGSLLESVAEHLEAAAQANDALEIYHRDRRANLTQLG